MNSGTSQFSLYISQPGLLASVPPWVLPEQGQVPVSGFDLDIPVVQGVSKIASGLRVDTPTSSYPITYGTGDFVNSADFISQSSGLYLVGGRAGVGNTSPLDKLSVDGNVFVRGNVAAGYYLGNGALLQGFGLTARTNDYDDLDGKPDLDGLKAAAIAAAVAAAGAGAASLISNALGGATDVAEKVGDIFDSLMPDGDPDTGGGNKEEDYIKRFSWYNLKDRPLAAVQKPNGLRDVGFWGNIYGAGYIVRENNIFPDSNENVKFETATRNDDWLINMSTKDANLRHIQAMGDITCRGRLSMGSTLGNNILSIFGSNPDRDTTEVMGFGASSDGFFYNSRNPTVSHRFRAGASEIANIGAAGMELRGNIRADAATFSRVNLGSQTGNNVLALYGLSTYRDSTDVVGFGVSSDALWYNSRNPLVSHRFRSGTAEVANIGSTGLEVRGNVQCANLITGHINLGKQFANNLICLWGDSGNLDTTEVYGLGVEENSLYMNLRNPNGVLRVRTGTGDACNVSLESLTHRGNLKAANAFLKDYLVSHRGVFNGLDPKVGIGTAAPQATLHVTSPSSSERVLVGADAGTVGSLRNAQHQVSLLGYSGQGYNSSGVKLYAGQYNTRNVYPLAFENSDGELDMSVLNGNLWLRGSLSASLVDGDAFTGNGWGLYDIDEERIKGNVRVVAGNVGIGTQAPTEKLDIQGLANVGVRILSSTAVDQHRVARLDLVRWDGALGDKAFGADLNTDWRLQNAGNLLLVSGDTVNGVGTRATLYSNGALQAAHFHGNGAYLTGLTGAALGATIDASQIVSGTINATRLPETLPKLVITNTLGVGNSQPTARLSVQGTAHIDGQVNLPQGYIDLGLADPSREMSAGKLVYGAPWDTSALSIVGKGGSVRVFDNLDVVGNVSAVGGTFSSGTSPQLNVYRTTQGGGGASVKHHFYTFNSTTPSGELRFEDIGLFTGRFVFATRAPGAAGNGLVDRVIIDQNGLVATSQVVQLVSYRNAWWRTNNWFLANGTGDTSADNISFVPKRSDSIIYMYIFTVVTPGGGAPYIAMKSGPNGVDYDSDQLGVPQIYHYRTLRSEVASPGAGVALPIHCIVNNLLEPDNLV